MTTDGSQEFCLRWNNHQATIISVFDYLLENETLVDCTLAAEGQYLKAHKVVLCACSPYLELLLSQHNDKHPILIFKDIKFNELKSMIDYMYKGEVNIAQDQLNHFLKAAESLQIKGLSESEDDATPQTATPTPRPPPPRAPPAQRTQPRPFNNAVAIRSTGPSDVDPDSPKRIIGRPEAQSPTPRKRRRQAPVPGRPSLSGDDASNASEGHFDQSNCDVPTPAHSTSTSLVPSGDSEKAVAKVETNSELMLEPKTEYDDNSVEDITLDDDDEDYSQAGTSQMDNSQGNFGNWQQMVGDQTGDDVFSGQDTGAQNSQDENMFALNGFDDFEEKETHSWNGETYYNCNECSDFNTTSERLLHEHVKYFHDGFYINPDSVLNHPYTEPHYLKNKTSDTNILNGHFDLSLVKRETLDIDDVDASLLGFNIKQEWFDGFEQEIKLDNVIIHKDVFECKICDEVFVCKQKYLNHLGSKMHIFNEISKNTVLPPNSSSGNSDDDDDADGKFGVGQVSLHGKNATPNCNGFSKDVKIKMENLDHSSKSRVNIESCDRIDYKSYMDEEHLKCKVCNYQTTQIKGLRTHILMHIKRSHTCETCGFQTPFKSALHEHYDSFHKGVPIACDQCDFTTSSYRYYMKHKEDHSNTEYCDLCNKNIFGKNKIYFHYFKIHKGYEFKCKICPYVTKNPKSFIVHKDAGHYRQSCGSCDFVASSKAKFVEHLRKGCTQSEAPRIRVPKREFMTVKPERELRSKVMVDNYSCNICNSYFKTHSLLEDHMKQFHCFPCEECDYIGFNLKSLINHEMSHKIQNKTATKASLSLGSMKALTTNEIQNKITSNTSSLLGGFCNFCSRRLFPNISMKRHIALRHSGNKPYQCPMTSCGQYFESSTTMTAHIQSVHAESLPYECKLCPHRYANSAGVKKHMKKVHSSLERKNILSCTKCSYQTPKKNALSSHMRVHSSSWIYYSENSSHNSKGENTSNDKHMESTSNEREVETLLSCTKCSYQALSRKSLNSHMRVHSSSYSSNNRKRENTPSSSKCSYQASVGNSLSAHIMKVKLKRKYRVKNTSNNGKVGNTSNKLKMNFVNSDTEESDLTCSKCDRVFLTTKTWKQHRIFHNMDRKIVCKDCGFRFRLQKHKDSHQHYHRSSNKYVCELCNLRFAKSYSHKNHMMTHRKLAYFDCTICDFTTNSRASLDTHTLVHADEMKYSCKLCDYKCESQALYLKHLKGHKTGNSGKKTAVQAESNKNNGWYKCSTCEKCFVTLNILLKHSLNVHSTRPTVHLCACGKQFCQPGNLTRHIRVHTQTDNSTHEQSVSSLSPIIMLSPIKPKKLKRKRAEIPFNDVDWPFKCVICDKEFKTIITLKDHMESGHNSNTYKCRECNFVTNKALNLTAHLPVHPSYLKCNLCNLQLSCYQHKLRHLENYCKGSRSRYKK